MFKQIGLVGSFYWYTCESADQKLITGINQPAKLIESDTSLSYFFDGDSWELEALSGADVSFSFTHTAATTSAWHRCTSENISVHVGSDVSHVGTSLITIEVANDTSLKPLPLGQNGAVVGASDSDGFSSPNRWGWVRSVCTEFGGAGSVSVVIGE